jgi:NADPH:quinone reductase-like Zn-dependent oxidoreductase
MRAAGIDQLGDSVHEIELPEPRPLESDEVLIEARAAGVGNWDDTVPTGHGDVGLRPPMALGLEASGVILSVGERVSEWSAGDDVMTTPSPPAQGAWSELLIAPAQLFASKPEAIEWEEAGAAQGAVVLLP